MKVHRIGQQNDRKVVIYRFMNQSTDFRDENQKGPKHVLIRTRPLKPNQRMKIITTGMHMKNSGQKVTHVELSKRTNFDRTCKFWWDRKDLLLTAGKLCDRKKGRLGRPIHPPFSNKQKIDHAITVCENLVVGQHLPDTAKELKCGQRTFERHLKKSYMKKIIKERTKIIIIMFLLKELILPER